MRKAISILLLIFYITSIFHLQELGAIPKLWQHFEKHQLKNQDLGLIEFLTIHYFNGDVKDADYQEDMKLPFKSIDNSLVFSINVLPSATEWKMPLMAEMPKPKELIFQLTLKEQNYISYLLRPPIYI